MQHRFRKIYCKSAYQNRTMGFWYRNICISTAPVWHFVFPLVLQVPRTTSSKLLWRMSLYLRRMLDLFCDSTPLQTSSMGVTLYSIKPPLKSIPMWGFSPDYSKRRTWHWCLYLITHTLRWNKDESSFHLFTLFVRILLLIQNLSCFRHI